MENQSCVDKISCCCGCFSGHMARRPKNMGHDGFRPAAGRVALQVALLSVLIIKKDDSTFAHLESPFALSKREKYKF